MKNVLKMLLGAALCLSTLPLAAPAFANNRAFNAFSAVLDNPSSAPCFAHVAGVPTLTNACSTSQSVFLPMSVDAAYWYTVSVYGKGWIAGDGTHNTIWCVANTVPHNSTGTLWGSSWAQLPTDSTFGGDQTLVIGETPVYAPGDAAYAYCQMAPNTQIFSYGWN
jgi:hypothetical protein